MFKLSRAAEYAVRGVVYIAGKEGGEVVHIREISEKQDVPEYFLVKVFSRLARNGIVYSVRGNRGGFKLAKPPGKISLFDILSAVEGPINLNDCLVCKNRRKCSVKPVWDRVKDDMVKVLKKSKIADMVNN